MERAYIHISSLRLRKSEILLSCERLRVVGGLIGALVGLGSTYNGYFEAVLVPAWVQIACISVNLAWFAAVFPKFYTSTSSDKEQLIPIVHPLSPWHDRAQNTSEDNRKLINYAKESVRHWGVFCGLFANMVLHFSTSVRDVAIPVLMLGQNEDFHVNVENVWGLQGLYSVFVLGTAAGAVGREVYRFLVTRWVFDRALMLCVLVGTAVGWVFLVPEGSVEEENGLFVSFPNLTIGFTLITLGTTLLPESSYNVYHRVLGPLSSSFYTSAFLVLGGVGAWLGPLWTWEAARLDTGLCFSFVTLWLGAVLAVLLAAWPEAVPYEEFMSRFVEKFPQKGKFET